MKHQRYFTSEERLELRTVIKEKTGYFIVSNNALSQAFRRRSFCAENGGKSNEVFEFMGDTISGYYVVKAITKRCIAMNVEGDYSFRIRENHFTSLKQELTSNEIFASIIDEWGIAEYLIVSTSDETNQVNQQIKIKADLFEAIIGAIAIDSDWNDAVLENVIVKALNIDERINSLVQEDYFSKQINIDNAVSKLKEEAEKEFCSMPTYEFGEPKDLGYDENGNPKWSCICGIINDITGISRLVFASSKKDAKKAAAYLVLCEHFEIQNQYGVNKKCPIWVYKNGELIPLSTKDKK